jgi:hypothetical protein
MSISRRYHTVSPEQQMGMTGLKFVQGLANGTLPLNAISKTLGYDITEAESGWVVVTAEPRDVQPPGETKLPISYKVNSSRPSQV